MENLQNTVTTTLSNEGETTQATKKLMLIKHKSKSNSRGVRTSGGKATIVNSKENGKRMTFPKSLLEELGIEDNVDVSITPNGLAIGNELPKNAETFQLKMSGNKGVIYSASLVQEITEVFELDFSDRVSITFNEAEIINDGEYLYAEIKIK
jgi:hypothetical protein